MPDDTLHTRLLAALDERLERARAEIRRVEALRRVVERHRPVHRWTTDYCKHCGGDWVCDDIRDLAAGEGIEVGE